MTEDDAGPDGTLEIHPLTPERWPDLERLFGPRGAVSGCWCMWWRLPAREFDAGRGEANREAQRAVVAAGPPPGLLVYVDGEPAGWCAVAPRACYPRLDRSRALKRVDDLPVWSITCFFIARRHRRRGLSRALIAAAVDFAREYGATTLEAYPVDPEPGRFSHWDWTGMASSFRDLGFQEVARRSARRPVMRVEV